MKSLARPRTVLEFMDAFNTDEKCLNYIAELKWAEGCRCYCCGTENLYFLSGRNLIRCKNCGYEESFIANTLMRNTHKPIRFWFWALYIVSIQKTGMSAMELYRQLDFGSYRTAWTWLHKIRMAMVNPDRTQLHKEVEVDETYIQTGKAGRGRALGGKKALIICAVEIKDTKKGKIASGRIRLRHLSNASAKQIHPFVIDHVEKGAIVRTDGWTGYENLSEHGYKHIINIVGDSKLASKKFPRVHRVFANLKSWLIGTHRYVSTKHLQNYLNEYMFRFNRRYVRESSFDTLLRIALLDRPREYKGFAKPKKPYYANPARNA